MAAAAAAGRASTEPGTPRTRRVDLTQGRASVFFSNLTVSSDPAAGHIAAPRASSVIAQGQGGAWRASWGRTEAEAIAKGVAACAAHGGKACAERRTISSF